MIAGGLCPSACVAQPKPAAGHNLKLSLALALDQANRRWSAGATASS
jgi:hypothetical protein